jgi:c-di-GMP-binding flagellar brake protein YcgR
VALNQIRKGNRVEIALKDKTQKRRRLATTVEAVLTKNRIAVAMPVYTGHLVRLPVQDGYSLRILTGADLYRYDAMVTEHIMDEKAYYTVFKLYGDGEHVQQRKFFRLNIETAFHFTCATEFTEVAEMQKVYEGVTRDVSGGGMMFVSDAEFDTPLIRTEGVQSTGAVARSPDIEIKITLGGNNLNVAGEVLERINQTGESYPYCYRVRFKYLTESEESVILKYVNEIQRRGNQAL